MPIFPISKVHSGSFDIADHKAYFLPYFIAILAQLAFNLSNKAFLSQYN